MARMSCSASKYHATYRDRTHENYARCLPMGVRSVSNVGHWHHDFRRYFEGVVEHVVDEAKSSK